MCGRFQIAWPWRELVELFRVSGGLPDELIVPRFNICPTYRVPIVLSLGGERVAREMRWGFPATWLARQGKDPWSRVLFNAKAEDAPTKPTWRKAFRERRCLVPASGFYEWHKEGKARFPVLFSPADGKPRAFAGLWGSFKKGDDRIDCFTILTTEPGDQVGAWHHRAAVVLDQADWDRWLDPSAPDVASLWRPPPALALSPVSTRLNDIKNTGADLMDPDWALPDQSV